jgi:hypothetical protein
MTPLLVSGPVRMFRLSNEPGERGLSCTPDGVALAGVPLLRKTQAGFVPRPANEIASLLKAAFGERPMALPSRLGAIAQALNRGDFASAMIAAVHTQTPELTAEAAARLVRADRELMKYDYNPEESRDWHGRWTGDGSSASAPPAAPAVEADQRTVGVDNTQLRVAENTLPPDGAVASDAPSSSTSGPSEAPARSEASIKQATLQRSFEDKYDNLGPEEFSKKVIEFGYRLEGHGQTLSPADKEVALAEYDFLQGRLSTWINYEYKSARESNYLLSAATWLFQGGSNSGLVPVGHLPASMLSVAGTVALFDTPPPSRLRPKAEPDAENLPKLTKPPEGIEYGAIVERKTAGIAWGKGAKEQGLGDGEAGWEKYVVSQNPNARLLRPGSTGFDVFDGTTGEATSAKTMDTTTPPKITRPQTIYNEVKRYVDDALDYEPRRSFDLEPEVIKSKTIQLAIPEHTSLEQWRYLLRAIIYGKDNNVKVVITLIRR